MTLRLVLPPLLALGIGWALALDRAAGAALVGGALWLGLVLARRPLPLRFAALAFFAAVTFGFTAAVFAAFAGRSLRELIELPLADHFVGIALGCAAVAFAALAAASAAWTLVTGRRADDGEDNERTVR